MAFQSPSDRLGSLLGNFLLLRRIDGFRLARMLWVLTLIVYGSMIAVQAFNAIQLFYTLPGHVLRFGFFYNSAFTILTMAIYIIMVRLAIEIAFKLLGKSAD